MQQIYSFPSSTCKKYYFSSPNDFLKKWVYLTSINASASDEGKKWKNIDLRAPGKRIVPPKWLMIHWSDKPHIWLGELEESIRLKN